MSQKNRYTEELQQIEIEKLVPYANNSRTHSEHQLKKLQSSLREFGFINPILIDREHNIIAGHGRVLAAKANGMKSVPCVYVDHLSDAQKKAYIIADNRLAEDAGWDEALLAVELEHLQELEFDLDLVGFDADELDKLLNNTEGVEDDDFDVDGELEKPSTSALGDVWLLGRHRLVCGDSTKKATFDLLMEDKKANLVVTDPPYNVDYEGSAGKIKNDNMAKDTFYQFLLDAFTNTEDALSKDGSIYVFHADTEGLNFRRAFEEAGFYLSGTCIWKKQSIVLGRSPYQWKHEPILFGWKKKGRHRWYSDRKQSTIWEFDKPKRSADHPTMKPVPLIAYPITNSSLTNSIVLDPFGGSGSTLIAAEQTDRICYTIELDEKYCDVIVKRYIEQVGSDEDVYVIRDNQKISYSELGVSASA
ncbi:DNA (cytosine-5-)-methyltransferase [Sporosarcina newyorkensis 2681]|uniref:Methyltransferase n=1 Tax=Sporosarcina newyorkensis 2681 TaxID=1027292 RepID=F9DR38_9BACL|nr:site-specific DNA-methyltransferase [Sporosarcina newyorkensis]EGQ26727.1 DNA (cytosine-5-)-methyltransferase [Sporosarcina newyorkensis 2681]